MTISVALPSRIWRRLCPAWVSLGVVYCLSTSAAWAGPWNRDPGHFYVNLNYSRIAAGSYFDQARLPEDRPGKALTPGGSYTQHVVGLYSEVGIVKRWLMGIVEFQAFRHHSLVQMEMMPGQPSGTTYGAGDLRVGVQTGLVEKKVHLAATFLLGVGVGDPHPVASDEGAPHSGRALRLGSGDINAQIGLALGEGFQFSVIQGFGVISTAFRFRDIVRRCGADCPQTEEREQIAHEFLAGGELGFRIAKPIINRLTLIFRLSGQHSLAGEKSLQTIQAPYTGLGNGVSYFAYGGVADITIFRGLHAGIQVDSAFLARFVPAGSNIKPYVSYEW